MGMGMVWSVLRLGVGGRGRVRGSEKGGRAGGGPACEIRRGGGVEGARGAGGFPFRSLGAHRSAHATRVSGGVAWTLRTRLMVHTPCRHMPVCQLREQSSSKLFSGWTKGRLG
jgi:hypothetical protein